MKLVIFGLTMTSSWGNGHATLWRGLCRALHARGHRVVFFERDVPYYAAHRDSPAPPGVTLHLYRDWPEAEALAFRELCSADAGMVTSFCPDGLAASARLLSSRVPLRVFYDLDTPVTLARLSAGEPVSHLGDGGLAGFDLVLSFTGGPALDALRDRLGARCTAALYGSADPWLHRPCLPEARFQADLSYLGTHSDDRLAALQSLLLDAARRRPDKRFMVGGALYPEGFPWPPNVSHAVHVAPADHPAFYGSSPLTLNLTRRPMAEMGHCPSGRLFEAAACGVPVISDRWNGLDRFFTPGREILLASSTDDTLAALSMSRARLAAIGEAARRRVLAEHTAHHRAVELEALFASPGRAERHATGSLRGPGEAS